MILCFARPLTPLIIKFCRVSIESIKHVCYYSVQIWKNMLRTPTPPFVLNRSEVNEVPSSHRWSWRGDKRGSPSGMAIPNVVVGWRIWSVNMAVSVTHCLSLGVSHNALVGESVKTSSAPSPPVLHCVRPWEESVFTSVPSLFDILSVTNQPPSQQPSSSTR